MDKTLLKEIQKRRTFAIISHPDAGKTTLTEKLLLFGGAIQQAGAVKSRNAGYGVRSLNLTFVFRQNLMDIATKNAGIKSVLFNS